MSKLTLFSLVLIVIVAIGYCASCSKSNLSITDNIEFKSKLSEYNIYNGEARSLSFNANFTLYTLATSLYSDYAEKQRLIKLPAGSKVTATGDELPEFPDGTFIVKTFYYYLNKLDTSLGKNIIETRLLIKSNGKWNAATYLWNEQQTDASLMSSAAEVPVNWIDQQGRPMVISYHVPSKIECGMCHRSDNDIIPIGPKIRNLNVDINDHGNTINQLQYLQNKGVLSSLDPNVYTSLPVWDNTMFSLEQRARAYLDVNCGHCHNGKGIASRTALELTYQTALNDSRISRKKNAIDVLMSRGAMPFIGTTIVHSEGLQLVRDYLKTIQ